MPIYTTKIYAQDPYTGELCQWSGPHIRAISFDDAQHICNTTGRGYCRVDGLLVEEIPCDESLKPDWDKAVNYENLN